MSDRLQDVDLSLVDSLMVPANLHDVHGRFVHINAAAELASGLSKAQLRGRHYTEPLLPEERKKATAQFRRAVEQGEPRDFETVFVDASGQRRAVRAQHLSLRSGDDIVGVLILAFAGHSPASEPSGLALQPRLMPRQRKVFDLLAAGPSTFEIAKKLTFSTETISAMPPPGIEPGHAV